MTERVDIMVIALCADGRVHPEIYDLLAFGQRLQSLGNYTMGVWIFGEHVDPAAQEIAGQGGIQVTAVACAGLSNYNNESYGAVLAEEIAVVKPVFVFTAHTSQGWEWAPAAAVRVGAGCICGVDGLTEFQGRICFQKELYGGKVKGLFSPNTATTVISLQPGLVKFARPAKASPGTVTHKNATSLSARTRYLGIRQATADTSDITTASILVAVGNGIGSQENIALALRLAECLPKAAVAGTRIVCDRGWLGYNRQVGVSGASVAPSLYIACGISGASQHVMGMRGAKFVIAINTDPRAPIFNEADICIVEDVAHFIPLIQDACARLARRDDRGAGAAGRKSRLEGAPGHLKPGGR
jgi:electron transfer flavoprotein alpha subunit